MRDVRLDHSKPDGRPDRSVPDKKHNLTPNKIEPQDVGVAESESIKLTHHDLFDSLLAIHLCMIIGSILKEVLFKWRLALPLFVTCLFTGIVFTSLIDLIPNKVASKRWPSRTQATALIADLSLGAFLAMSLISLQLWTLVDLAVPIFAILALQVLALAHLTWHSWSCHWSARFSSTLPTQ